MSQAALARLPEPQDAPLTLEAFLRANAAPLGVDLGTCVLVSAAGGSGRFTIEGVVIEVVPPGGGVRSAQVVYLRPGGSSRSTVARYVVQCRDRRVVRRLTELAVVCR